MPNYDRPSDYDVGKSLASGMCYKLSNPCRKDHPNDYDIGKSLVTCTCDKLSNTRRYDYSERLLVSHLSAVYIR